MTQWWEAAESRIGGRCGHHHRTPEAAVMCSWRHGGQYFGWMQLILDSDGAEWIYDDFPDEPGTVQNVRLASEAVQE